MAQVAKIKQLSQKETKYVRINYKGEVIDADKSLLKILLSKNTDKKNITLSSIFFAKKNISLKKIKSILETEKIFKQTGDLKIGDSDIQSCQTIYILQPDKSCIDVVFNFVENTEGLIKEIEALNSIADHNFQKLLKANEKLDAARRAEKEALSSKEKFLTNISHELRTPLTGISGILQLLSKTKINQTQSDYLNSITHSTKNMVTMINELLDFSKLKSGKFELKIADFSLEDCINYTASAFSIISLDTKINFNLSYDKAIPAILKGDSLRISQVINNLLNNAFKFTNRGFVYLETKLLHQANNIGWVELKVSDSGIGIPKDRLGKIFDEFYQADTPTPLHTAGTGLGLAISKHLVQIHGGTINVTSKPGSGTTFSVTIPFELGQQKKRLNTGVKKLLLQGKQILICDDNPVNLLIMEKVLSEQGATVTMTKNGKEVLPLLKLKTFDIFLIDLNMPVMNGFELAQELKKKNKAPMLAVTAGNGELLIKKCDRAGFSGIIFKPFSNEELIKQTIECLANKTSLKSKSSETEKLHPINLKKINSIANGNQKTFNELISSITSNLETNIPQLKEAIETGNFKKIRSFTHQLRTIYGYLDLKNELQSVITIEALSEQKKNIAKIRLLFNPLYQQHNQLKSELISLLN